MNTFEKKLEKIASKSKDESESIVDEAKLLLASNVAEERTLLTSIGLDNDIRIVESKNEEIIIRNTHGSKLGKTILHFNDIKKLCLDYRLYFRKANKYVGTIPPELGSELNRFCKEKNIVIPAHSDHSNFHIIAPPKMFNDYISPSKVFLNAIKYADDGAAERKRLKDLDPILVYQIDKNHFAIIKSWGNDFAPLRRVYGFFTRIKMVKTLNIVLNGLFLYGLFKFAIWQMRYFTKLAVIAHQHHKNDDVWMELGIFIFLCLIVVAGLWLFLDYTRDFRKSIITDVTKSEVEMKKYNQKR